ncbi:MAG: hemerythrin domain-containing protein [Bacteroidales bacterium]|nr:hemerythrin domain-containing protein [Bacteroidales bacterium]
MIIKPATQLADAIHENIFLLPVLNRFDIQLGFGNKTVEQLCAEKGVNMQFFLEIVNSFLDKDYFPQSELQSFPIRLIIDYISRSHTFYLKYKLPQIEGLIVKLLENAEPSNKKAYSLIRGFFEEYARELIVHIEKEEDFVHPYILAIDDAYNKNLVTPEIIMRVKQESINKYADGHDNVEDKLFDLKNLIIRYLPPAADYTLSNAILYDLFRLERDLNDHARIEEKVLVPKVRLLEKRILAKKA